MKGSSHFKLGTLGCVASYVSLPLLMFPLRVLGHLDTLGFRYTGAWGALRQTLTGWVVVGCPLPKAGPRGGPDLRPSQLPFPTPRKATCPTACPLSLHFQLAAVQQGQTAPSIPHPLTPTAPPATHLSSGCNPLPRWPRRGLGLACWLFFSEATGAR